MRMSTLKNKRLILTASNINFNQNKSLKENFSSDLSTCSSDYNLNIDNIKENFKK